MDKVAFDEYLEKRYYDQLNYYHSASKKNQKQYKNIQWVLIILSTATTILAALPATGNFIFIKYVVVVSAALVTILTSGLKTFQYQELWVNCRSTMEQLKPEIYYYNFGVGDYGKAGVDKESLFVSRVEQILNQEHVEWPAVKKLKEQDKQVEHGQPEDKSESTSDSAQSAEPKDTNQT